MHLLLAQKGAVTDGEGEAVDLGQSPGDVCFLSAADTELASLAAAHRAGDRLRSLRLVNLMQLRHPMSVDTWIDRTGRHAKLIVARLLGGQSYWGYAVEALRAAADAHGFKLALLPGDDKPDPGLAPFATVPAADGARLWALLREGGPDNARAFLGACDDLIAGKRVAADAVPFLKAGAFADAAVETGAHGRVAIVFYRALVQSGQTAPVEALAEALAARGMAVTPIYVTSLKDDVSAATVAQLFADASPDVVINMTGFAVSAPGRDRVPTVLESTGAPVLQAVLGGSSEKVWRDSSQGLTARDLAMNVALPEVDGRVLSRAISFKAADGYDDATECTIATHRPVPDRIAFVADLAANWVRLRRTPAPERRAAIVLANYPNRDGRLANGVGLDTPAGTVEVLNAMRDAGYRTGDFLPMATR